MTKPRAKGFTIIELVVAIAVFGILSSIMLVNFRSNQDFRDLKLEAANMESLLGEAQNFALTGGGVGGVNYEKFIINAASCENGDCSSLVMSGQLASATTTLKTLELLKTEIKGVNQDLEIIFSAPRANASIDYDGQATTSITIRLESLNDASLAKCVEFSSVSGRTGITNCD